MWNISWRETNSTTFHADLQTIWWFTTGIHYATVHVTWAVTVVSHFLSTAATAGLWRAQTTRYLSYNKATEGDELTEQTGQDTMDTAILGTVSVTVGSQDGGGGERRK